MSQNYPRRSLLLPLPIREQGTSDHLDQVFLLVAIPGSLSVGLMSGYTSCPIVAEFPCPADFLGCPDLGKAYGLPPVDSTLSGFS